MEKTNILGLSIGTQLMGMALLKNLSLEDRQVKNFEGSWSKMKLRIIVQTADQYIKEHSVTTVALKVPEPCRSSPAIETLTDALIRLCESKNIPLYTYTVTDLKKYCGAVNKEGLIQYVLAIYPELSSVFARKQKVKKVYYVKIFEAVLASMLP